MRNTKTKEFLKVLAQKYKISVNDVKLIVSSPFEFTRHVMENVADKEELHFPSIRIPSFGVIFCPPYVKEKFRTYNNQNKDESASDQELQTGDTA
jgi:hypothetical protein